MPLISDTIAALPYIDVQVSAQALSEAQALIDAELADLDTTTLHHAIPNVSAAQRSSLVDIEHERLARGVEKDAAVDLARYEALDAPGKGDVEAWRETLERAYISAEYMRSRESNLSLLEAYGKNAWLVGNSQLEDILRDLERDLDAAKLEHEAVQNERKATQDNAAGEMHSLGETWRQGVGRMLETQAAAEGLRQEILRRKRDGAL